MSGTFDVSPAATTTYALDCSGTGGNVHKEATVNVVLPPPPPTLLNGLVSYWKFDESSGNALDSVGTNTLTNNGAIQYALGKINNAADLESSSSQYYSLSDASQTGLDPAADFSWCEWVNYESLPTAYQNVYLAKRGPSNFSYQFGLYDNSGQFEFDAILSSNGTSLTEKTINWTPSTGTWYHLCFSYKASTGTGKFYVNGSQFGSDLTGFPTSVFDGTGAVYISWDTVAGYLDGKMDETGFWSRELSSAEISQLYNGGAGKQYPF